MHILGSAGTTSTYLHICQDIAPVWRPRNVRIQDHKLHQLPAVQDRLKGLPPILVGLQQD